MSVEVYKLGGSLLLLPDLRKRLRRVLQSTSRPLVVVGGGGIVDAVRRWDEIHNLGDESSHRLAIETLGITASMVAKLLETETCANRDRADDLWGSGRPVVLDVPRFLREEERRAREEDVTPLPASWDVTSDSIAAWVAIRWPADSLVLLKSCAESAGNWDRAAEAGLVDPTFPSLVTDVPNTRWVNLAESE